MLLDVSVLRLLGKDDFRVLRAVELGMRNHEIVPVPLIVSISRRRQSVSLRSIRELLKHKLLHHENIQYDGYRLTTSGYDFLAIHTLVCRGIIHGFGRRIGTGKESDVYEVAISGCIAVCNGLGRISFRAVKNKRDYLRHRKNFNWLYLSRLAALGEYAFMKALYKRGFPVPEPIEQNRHVVLMSVVDGYPLSQVKQMGDPGSVFQKIMYWFVKFTEVGLVHCDFNEFNLMISDDEEITIIDFPQMVSVWHENAEELFHRDRECILNFFMRRFHYHPDTDASLEILCPDFEALKSKRVETSSEREENPLDQELRASGFKQSHREILAKHAQGEDLDDKLLPESTDDASSAPRSSNYSPFHSSDNPLCCTSEEDPETENTTGAPPPQRAPPSISRQREVAQKVTLEQKKMMTKKIKHRMKNSNKKRGKGKTAVDL